MSSKSGSYNAFKVLHTRRKIVYKYLWRFFISQSKLVQDSLYNCRWYDCTPKMKKLLRISLTRAQKPSVLRIGKSGILSYDTFSEVRLYFIILNYKLRQGWEWTVEKASQWRISYFISYAYLVRPIKSIRLEWVGHVARMEENRGTSKFWQVNL